MGNWRFKKVGPLKFETAPPQALAQPAMGVLRKRVGDGIRPKLLSLLVNMLKFEPTERISAASALSALDEDTQLTSRAEIADGVKFDEKFQNESSVDELRRGLWKSAQCYHPLLTLPVALQSAPSRGLSSKKRVASTNNERRSISTESFVHVEYGLPHNATEREARHFFAPKARAAKRQCGPERHTGVMCSQDQALEVANAVATELASAPSP